MNIVLIGAGNVGYHLGYVLNALAEVQVIQVFSRTEQRANFSASYIGCEGITTFEQVNREADLYIIAVRDSVIEAVAQQLCALSGMQDKLVVHTSGATAMSVLQTHFERVGIFYPLQSFSIHRKVDFSIIPFCLYTSQEEDLYLLEKLAKKISNTVAKINDEQRANLHVAAVFVNNFANHLYAIGNKITDTAQVDFDFLKPLILETALKIQDASPLEMQTGPAKRADSATIEKHSQYLNDYPDFQKIYKSLTESIQSSQHSTFGLLPSPLPFLEQLFLELKADDADFSAYPIDHICYRVHSLARYDFLREKLKQYGSVLTEKEINGRPITVFRLNAPFVFKEQKIDILELPAPKEESPYREGFEHIEMVIDLDFQAFQDKYNHLIFNTKAINKKVNPEIRLTLSSGSVKFHHHPLDYVIEYLD